MESAWNTILIGHGVFSSDWTMFLKKIKEPHIKMIDFNDIEKIYLDEYTYNNSKDATKSNYYILPLCINDYNILVSSSIYQDIYENILHPPRELYDLLNNKLAFTSYMLEHFAEYIPYTYYLDDKQINADIVFPVIYKPKYSINAAGMRIISNMRELNSLRSKTIIQKYISNDVLNITPNDKKDGKIYKKGYEYEYGAYFLCIKGIIKTSKIIKSLYPKYAIKTSNFPSTYETADVLEEQILMEMFSQIVEKLNYSGGMCINFKYNTTTNKLDIFEINPRFGGSAFSNNFIKDLLTF